MKKLTLILAILMATIVAKAQTVDSIPHHSMGYRDIRPQIFMEMSDGSIIGGYEIADVNPLIPLGDVWHKVSRGMPGNGLEIVDTLLLPNDNFPWHLTAKDPQGDGNIFVEFGNNFDEEYCYLKIRRFNDDLIFDTTEVFVQIAQFIGNIADPGLLLDPYANLIFAYYENLSPLKFNFVKMDLDGTIKYQKTVDSIEIDPRQDIGPIVFNQSPLQYCYWGFFHKGNPSTNFGINCYILDSLFNVQKTYRLPNLGDAPDYSEYDLNGFYTKMLGLGDGNLLVARPYHRMYNLMPYIEDQGVALIKYDSSFQKTAIRKFHSEPYLENEDVTANPIGLGRSKDGNIYFAYYTNTMRPYYGNYYGRVSVVKMDCDLNIIWQRYCLEPQGYGRSWGMMQVLEDNSVAVSGINTITTSNGQLDHTEVFYVVVNDDYDALEEEGLIVRPYAYWPNPAQDELHLQFSPDVTPTQIELYDLQGRLVHMQRKGLESLNMEGLASGAYTMRVTLEGGKVFSDKVIKE